MKMTPLSKAQVLALRPQKSSPIELELEPHVLQDGRSRAFDFFTKSGAMIEAELLQTAPVVRGWVCKVFETRDTEGPDYQLWFAFEWNGQVYQLRLNVGYDQFHWALSAPEHCDWFQSKLSPGAEVTILVDTRNLENSVVFGQLETFRRVGSRAPKLKWIAT